MKQLWFILCLCAIGFLACKPEGVERVEGNSEKSVEAIKGTSDKVRNELTADKPLDESKIAKMEFEETSFDFGEVEEGKIVEHTYKFTNTGKVPLLITNAQATCGCTVPSYTESPIAPGKSGEVTLKFNSEGRVGEADKAVTITANTYPQLSKVHLKGIVKKKGE